MTIDLARDPKARAKRRDATPTAYDADFHGWTERQSQLLRAGRVAEIDLENLAEEIEALGRSEIKSLRNALKAILLHVLKWDHQPAKRSTSWVYSIRNGWEELALELRDSPSLKAKLPGAIEDAYRQARMEAARQMKIDEGALPATCPYAFADIVERPFAIDHRDPD